MGVELLTERLKDQITGVLSCWDRVLIFGTLPKICYAQGILPVCQAGEDLRLPKVRRAVPGPPAGECRALAKSSTKNWGYCYVRVPTWLPCRLQIYFNGHKRLATKLRRLSIDCKLVDNALVEIADWARSAAFGQRES